MNLRRIGVFVRVVEEGSFAAAARAMGVPRSSVSQAVAQLEADLGVRLLHRSTRAMTLTDAGNDLYGKTAPALRAIAEAASDVSDRQGPVRGRVRLTAPVEVGTRLLEPVLSRFLVREPGVSLDLILTGTPLDLVEHGIDLAVRGGSVVDAELVARRLGPSQTAGLFASPGYLALRGTPRRLEDLSGHDSISLRGPRRAWRLHGPDGPVSVSPHVRVEVDAFGYAVRATCAGVGVAMLPAFLCESEVLNGLLVRVLPAYAVEEKPLWLVYPSRRNLSRAVAAVRDALCEGFAVPGARG